MIELIKSLESSQYVASTEQIETLAAMHADHSEQTVSARGTYLRVLLAGCQMAVRDLGDMGRAATETQIKALDEIHQHYYPAVLRGVARGEPIELSELQRRGTFARSAKSTLAAYVWAGGMLRTLDVRTVSKGSLRALTKPPEPKDRDDRIVSRARGTLLRALEHEIKFSPDAAAAHIETLISELRALHRAAEKKETRVVRHSLRRQQTGAHAPL